MLNKLYFSRYTPFNTNGTQITIPFIQLDSKTTDKKVVWKSNRDRMDKMSLTYYDDPRYGWLILLGNPSFAYEFDIPDNTILTVPYPLLDTINEYQTKAGDFSKNN